MIVIQGKFFFFSDEELKTNWRLPMYKEDPTEAEKLRYYASFEVHEASNTYVPPEGNVFRYGEKIFQKLICYDASKYHRLLHKTRVRVLCENDEESHIIYDSPASLQVAFANMTF